MWSHEEERKRRKKELEESKVIARRVCNAVYGPLLVREAQWGFFVCIAGTRRMTIALHLESTVQEHQLQPLQLPRLLARIAPQYQACNTCSSGIETNVG
jgi:hypothetical protein